MKTKLNEYGGLLAKCEKMTKAQLIELVLGVKPIDTKIGDVIVDGLYPASQIHLRVDRDDRFTDSEMKKIREAIKIPMCGMVHVQFVHTRVIITTSTPGDEREHWAQVFSEAITKALK